MLAICPRSARASGHCSVRQRRRTVLRIIPLVVQASPQTDPRGQRNIGWKTNTQDTGDTPAIGEEISTSKSAGRRRPQRVRVAAHGVVSAVTPKGRLVHLRPSKVIPNSGLRLTMTTIRSMSANSECISADGSSGETNSRQRRHHRSSSLRWGLWCKKGRWWILPLAGTFTSVEPNGWATILV